MRDSTLDFFDDVEVKDESRPDWIGLVTDNRRLFDALQDGWLRPLRSRTGMFLGVNAYLREQDVAIGNRIPVRIQLNVSRLPDLEVSAFRDSQWRSMPLSEVVASDAAVCWPGVLPTFAFRDIAVSSNERRVRLLSMAKRISNVEVPDIAAVCAGEEAPLPAVPPPDIEAKLVVPAAEDSIRGAMTMALWAVPRIDPWLDLLAASLSSDLALLPDLAAKVDASWWRFPPWARTHHATPAGAQERLWIAAVDVLGSLDRVRPREAADGIAAGARQGESSDDAGDIEAWRRATHGILRADITIQHDRWRECPVGLAIQLVLSRPEPTAFKTWFDDDHMNLPPAVAWSAATLCGLFHGYRRLDTRFRGKPLQREVIAVQALRACSGGSGVRWPDLTSDPLKWRKETNSFVLSWGGCNFARKHEQERGKWYGADLENDTVQREALAIAGKKGWQCFSRVVTLAEGPRPFSGPGTVEVRGRAVNVRGSVRVHLSPDDRIEDALDVDSFRHLVSVEPGQLPAPTVLQTRPAASEATDIVSGLKLVPDFLSEAEEKSILVEINQSEWSEELQRRVQHYGWRYDYKSRLIDPSMYLGPLPDWASRIARRLFESGYVPELPDQVIVNEYVHNQGIAPHVDSESSFADGVAMVSLLETWEMEFRERHGRGKVTCKLERRSATILTGEARYGWTHEIPKRKTEPGTLKPGNKKPGRMPRGRRVSLTFRKVIGTGKDSTREPFLAACDRLHREVLAGDAAEKNK